MATDFRLLFRQLMDKFGVIDPSTPNMPLEERIQVRHQAVSDFFNHLDTREKFAEAMKTINLAWGEVRSPGEIETQTTVKTRGAIVQIDDRQGGTRRCLLVKDAAKDTPYQQSVAIDTHNPWRLTSTRLASTRVKL